MDTTDSGLPTTSKMLTDDPDQDDGTHEEVQGFTEGANSTDFKLKRVSRNIFINHSRENPGPSYVTRNLTPSRDRCPSPVSSALVGLALNQMNLKRSSSAPMINQLGVTTPPASQSPRADRDRLTLNIGTLASGSGEAGPSSSCSTPSGNNNGGTNREVSMDLDAASFASSFLASLNNPRPRRFSASFSPGSPGPAPNRVSQLRRQENTPDWETVSEKEFHGTINIAQSWEDLSLESMSMELPARRPSYTDQLWLSMPPGNSSASASASSSPAASPRVGNRFSPGVSSPTSSSPTRKSFTSRRSLSPIAVRPSILSLGLTNQGLKRKSDWDSSSSSSNNQMDCSPQPPAKRVGGLLGFPPSQVGTASCSNSSTGSPGASALSYAPNPFPIHPLQQHHLLLPHRGSPNSLETTGTESSVSSVSGDSPFFRPVDSPVNSPSDISASDSPHPKQ